MLRSLLDLAKQSTSDNRRDVLHALLFLFVERADTHSERETVLFGDVLTRLLDQVADEDRRVVSRQIAALSQTPHELALRLAEDTAGVAAPILQLSPVLTDADLIGIAGKASQQHLLAIAQRAGLVEPVTDVIVGRGAREVLETVARNMSARFTPAGLDQLGTSALVDPSLGEALSHRPDLTPAVARRIAATLTPEARARIAPLLHRDGATAAEIMVRATQLFDSTRIAVSQHRGEVRRMLVDIRSNYRKLDDAVDELLFQKRLLDVTLLLADLASVPESHVNDAMHKVNTAGIGAVCRSLGLGDAAFRRLSGLRCEKLRLPVSQIDRMMRDYAAIDPADATKALRQWRLPSHFHGLKRGAN